MTHVTIIGAGIIGASTAYYLAHPPAGVAPPKKITLVDEGGIAAGASGKSGGFLAEDWHSHDTSDLGVASFRLHAELAAKHDGEKLWGYRRVGAVSLSLSVPGPSRTKALPKELTWVSPSIVGSCSSIGTTSTCAQVHPGLMTPKLVELASAAATVEVIRARARKIIFKGDDETAGVEAVELSDGKRIPCSEVVVAAGPWIGSLVSTLLPPRLAKPVSGIRGSRAHSIVLKAPTPLSAHVLFTSLRLKGRNFEPEIYARPDGTAYVCGAGDGLTLPDSAESVQVDEGRIAALKEQTKAISPDVLGDAEVVKEQACYLPISGSTGSPIIGRLAKGVTVAGGHSCWGITLGPGTGKCVAEIILEGKAKSADISSLAP